MFKRLFFISYIQSLIATETDAPWPLFPSTEIAGGIPFPKNLPRFLVFKSPDRTSPRGEDSQMMEGTGQLTGAAAVTFFGKPANFHHLESEWKKRIVPKEPIHYKPPQPPVKICLNGIKR
jgi:hypothetical protein